MFTGPVVSVALIILVLQLDGTATVTVKLPICPGCKVPNEHVTGPVPPTGGIVQLPEVGGVYETKEVF